jgi:hypothetical protein
MPPGQEPDEEPPAGGRWRVTPALPGLKLAGATAFVLLAVVFGGDPVRLVLAGAAALALAGWALRDLIAPVRLAADPDGITVVVGFAGRRHLPWSQVERVRVDTRPRLGLRTETLEIDTGETLHLFSSYDLGAPPADVAARLAALRTGSAR